MDVHTRVVFTGDISFSRHFENGWQNQNLLAQEIKDFINNADHVVANVECPLTRNAFERNKALNHVSCPEAGKFLSEMGIKIWSLANNHIMDCGVHGITDTLKCAEDNHCQTAGAGIDLEQASKPAIAGDCVKVGILSISQPWKHLRADKNTPGAFTWDKKMTISNSVKILRKNVDWIVFVVHGGNEFADIALPYMREQYNALLDMGADIVIGHHPHVVQNYERVGKKMIFYSLGNFIFDTENQRDFAHTDTGMLVGIDFQKDAYSFDYLPVYINRKKQTVEVGNTPPVFCEIDEKEYSCLWPLEAKFFYPVDFKKRKKFSKRLASAPKPIVFAHEVYICKRKRERIIQWGRFLSYLGQWKTVDRDDIVRYIKE